ncbi:proteasome-activating nucleotidase, partial [Candidatus Poseidoniales archaeon]|nr:proteasome-activating nucleotidase [Candidatus Poseidoniales archaeon]
MGTDVEQNAPSRVMPQEDDLKNLEDAYAQLQDQAQNLINERSQMETDIRNLKKRAQRLDDEVRLLRAPPLIIGHLQDVLDDRTAIVRSSNGTVFQVSLNQRLEPKTLKPGTRVALNQDTLAVIEVLHDAWDPMVSGAEMVTKPDISYDEVAGLDE